MSFRVRRIDVYKRQIPRLYDVTEGRVTVGGRDVREYDIHALRDAVGIVLQKNVLFSGTVRENLRWGDPEADDETLWAACRAACADEFLERMPGGLDADLGQGLSLIHILVRPQRALANQSLCDGAGHVAEADKSHRDLR